MNFVVFELICKPWIVYGRAEKVICQRAVHCLFDAYLFLTSNAVSICQKICAKGQRTLAVMHLHASRDSIRLRINFHVRYVMQSEFCFA